MITRREFLVASGLVGVPWRALAQQPGKVWRIGYLQVSVAGDSRAHFKEALRELGYIEGKHIVVEWRSAGGALERLPALAAELVQLKVDAIASNGTPSTIAAQKATTAIPIVLFNVADPVASGIVKSLARPGGNVTGVSDLTGELGPKNLELLLSTIPNLRRLAVLFDPAQHGSVVIKKGVEGVGEKAGVTVLPVAASTTQELEDAFPRMKHQNAGAVLVAGGGFFTPNIRRIVDLAIKYGLPVASTNPPHVALGALMNYGPSRADSARRAVYYLDRILKGARPGDLPIEQPTKFELVINMKTAKALGLTIPQSILVRADRLIE